MTILVFNSGSSSIKAALFERQSGHSQTHKRLLDIRISGIGEEQGKARVDNEEATLNVPDYSHAINHILKALTKSSYDTSAISAVGHRVIHGGETFVSPTIITDKVEATIDAMRVLAPLHNPACLAGIRAARSVLAHCQHIAIFDTAFHATLPVRAKLYALSDTLTSKYGIRRFGFHGISHEYVSQLTATALGSTLQHLRIITCHLGNGCSVAAIENGRSVETSMGMTPLEGLVMGSRSGDIDAGILIQLMRDEIKSADEMETLLNRHSGLYGMTDTNNMQEIEKRAADGDESCRRAIHVFTHRARKYVGAYTAVMGGVDAIVFTGGIGENSAFIRHRIAQRFDYLGASLDEDRNRDAKLNNNNKRMIEISTDTSRVKLMVIATDEEVAIAQSVEKLITPIKPIINQPNIPIAVSARHVHLTETTIQTLFGEGYTLTYEFPLSQPGQFAAKETVNLIGPKNRIDGVRILGPARSKNQVEISRSDEFHLGVDAPVRASGDVENTPGMTLEGTIGSETLSNGVICALRHIHMHPSDAKKFHINHGDLVNVNVNSGGRDLTFGDVLVRVDENFRLEMHIDTDEANAADLKSKDVGTLMPLKGNARLVD